VLTNCDGNRDLIVHDKTGYLINDMDQHEMSKKICILIEDKTKRIEFGENGYRYYKKNHLLSNYIKNLTNHYKAFSS
jgi:glycosyltransferase involved in cell wall biosynthesis